MKLRLLRTPLNYSDHPRGFVADKSFVGLRPRQAGQVVIEYVLLLVVVTSLGAVIIRGLVSRDSAEPGLLVAKWHSLIKTIAEDNPEE